MPIIKTPKCCSEGQMFCASSANQCSTDELVPRKGWGLKLTGELRALVEDIASGERPCRYAGLGVDLNISNGKLVCSDHDPVVTVGKIYDIDKFTTTSPWQKYSAKHRFGIY